MVISAQNGAVRNRFGDKRAFEIMKDAGFTGVDFAIHGMNDFEEVVMDANAPSHAEKIRRLAEDTGLSVIASHAPHKFKAGMAMDETEMEFCRIVRSIEFAGWLGAPLIVVHALRLLPEERPEDLREEQDKTLALNLTWYRTLEPFAKKAGIKIAVENLPARGPDKAYCPRLLGDARSFMEILDLLDPERFTGCFDVGHANLTMKDPASFIREAGQYIHHLHLHDNDGHRDLHLMPAFGKLEGSGSKNTFSVPWNEVVRALSDVGYDGPFNYECSTWYGSFARDLIPEAMALSAKAAKNVIRLIEEGALE